LPAPPAHDETAAALYRTCRRQGRTVRKLIDCLIAVRAINAGIELLQDDVDFEILAGCSALKLAATRNR
jgi:predicted nucleic acid-binding protein